MHSDIKVCGLTFKHISSIPNSSYDNSTCDTYLCKEASLTLKYLGEDYYHPYVVFPTSFCLREKDGPPGRDFYKGENVEGSGGSLEEAITKFFLAWNRRLPTKLEELRKEDSMLQSFDASFKLHVRVVIEPTKEELKAEVKALKAKLAAKG